MLSERVKAQLDQEWRHAEEHVDRFGELSNAGFEGAKELIALIQSNEEYACLVMKACTIVEVQCMFNIESRKEGQVN